MRRAVQQPKESHARSCQRQRMPRAISTSDETDNILCEASPVSKTLRTARTHLMLRASTTCRVVHEYGVCKSQALHVICKTCVQPERAKFHLPLIWSYCLVV